MKSLSLLLCTLVLLPLAGCATAPKTEEKREDLLGSSSDALKQMKVEDSGLEGFLSKAHGYVVFPKIGKGAWIVGGSYGRGVVYEQGVFVGYADVSQLSIGLQGGGQTFMQILAFETKADLDKLKAGKITPTATASAVILKSGAAAAAKYTEGVAAFVKPIGGAMLEASVGGQQFSYLPK